MFNSKRSGRPAPCGPAFMHMKKAATLLDKLPDGIHTIIRDNNVLAAAKRIVESTEPLPANEAERMRRWIRSHLRQLTDAEEVARLVPCQAVQ